MGLSRAACRVYVTRCKLDAACVHDQSGRPSLSISSHVYTLYRLVARRVYTEGHVFTVDDLLHLSDIAMSQTKHRSFRGACLRTCSGACTNASIAMYGFLLDTSQLLPCTGSIETCSGTRCYVLCPGESRSMSWKSAAWPWTTFPCIYALSSLAYRVAQLCSRASSSIFSHSISRPLMNILDE